MRILRFAGTGTLIVAVPVFVIATLGLLYQRHPKLKEVLHQNFADCSPLADALSDQDAVVYCLGTYTGSVSTTNCVS